LWGDDRNADRFVGGTSECEVLFHRAKAYTDKAAALGNRWAAGGPQPKTFDVGQVRIAIAVNKNNSVRHLTFAQIRDMLRVDGDGKQWQDVDGGTGTIHPYGEIEFSTSRLVIRQACMMVGSDQPGWHYTFRPEFEMLDDAEAVASKLRTDRQGIGFFLYAGQALPPHVKLVAVARSADEEPVALQTGRVIQEDYPLDEHLVLYLRPDASAAARGFCEFAVSPAGAEIAARHGLTTPAQDAESAKERRLADAKAGRGQKVFAGGSPMLRALIPNLAAEYVRASETIQVSYAATDAETGVIAGFVSDRPNRPEIVFLDGPPRGKALEVHGDRWKELNPEGHLVAGRAAAIVVNAANTLDALTLEQIEAIWSGAIDDWSALDGTGLSPPDAPLPGSNGPNAIPVHRIGLRKNAPAAEIFGRARPARAKQGRMTFMPGTLEVVAAVGTDPYALGVVDLADIPKTGQTIKVLGIMVETGDDGGNAAVVCPSADTIRAGTYPFAERTFVYVHPQASDTAKRFAGFLASESSTTAYKAHGLVPLIEAESRKNLTETGGPATE
jgi:ABC-type phosphate transport system substrate-binding protein